MSRETQNGDPLYLPFDKIITPELRSNPNPFDSHPVIDWYMQSHAFLTAHLDSRLEQSSGMDEDWMRKRVADSPSLPLAMADIGRLLGLFPQNIHDYNRVSRIQSGGAYWYHVSTTSDNPLMTENSLHALSSTALILAFLHPYKANANGIVGGKRDESIEGRMVLQLNRIPHQATTHPAVARLAAAETLVHMYAKAAAITMIDNGYVRLPDGRLIDGEGFIMNVFSSIAEAHAEPISYYSSTLRHPNGTFFIEEHSGRKRAILREFAEAATLKLLGYNAGPYLSLTRVEDAMQLWPDIDALITDFLQGALVSQHQAEQEPEKIMKDIDLIEEYLLRLV